MGQVNFSTCLLLLTHSLSPLLSQSALGSGEHKAASSANTGAVNIFTFTVIEIITIIIVSLNTGCSYPPLFPWLHVDRACIMLSAHQHPISPQSHYQAVKVLQKGAWESHSSTQHLLKRAWQLCHPTRQKPHPQLSSHYLHFSKEPSTVCGNVCLRARGSKKETENNSWLIKYSLRNTVYLRVLGYPEFCSWCTTLPGLGMSKTETSRRLKEKAYKPFLNPLAHTKLWHTSIVLYWNQWKLQSAIICYNLVTISPCSPLMLCLEAMEQT